MPVLRRLLVCALLLLPLLASNPLKAQADDLYWGPNVFGYAPSFDWATIDDFEASFGSLWMDGLTLMLDSVPILSWSSSGFIYPHFAGLPNSSPFQSNWYGIPSSVTPFVYDFIYDVTFVEDGEGNLVPNFEWNLDKSIPFKTPQDGDNLYIYFGIPDTDDLGQAIVRAIDADTGDVTDSFEADNSDLSEFDVKVDLGKDNYQPWFNDITVGTDLANLIFQSTGRLEFKGKARFEQGDILFQGGELVGSETGKTQRTGVVINNTHLAAESGSSLIDVLAFYNNGGQINVDAPLDIFAANIENDSQIIVTDALTLGTYGQPLHADYYAGSGWEGLAYGNVHNTGNINILGGSLAVHNDMLFYGEGGQIYLEDGQITASDEALGSTLINEQTIAGYGTIGGNGLVLANAGLVTTQGGTMKFNNVEVQNQGGTIEVQNGGTLVIESSRVAQGTVINDGSILRSNAATLHNVNLIGDMTVSPTLTLEDALNFDGTIDLSSTSSTPRKILLGTDTVVLTGGGTIRLAENGSYSRSIIQLLDGQTLDLVGATIKTPVGYDNYLGYGAGTVLNKGTLLADGGSFQINPQTLVNDGEILSTSGTLYLQDIETLTHRGTMVSQDKIQIDNVGGLENQTTILADGGEVSISNSEIQNAAGVLKAQNGGELVLNSSRIDQGAIINNGSILRSNAATLHNVNLIGDMTVSPTLTLEDALNFDGTIDLSSTSSTPRKILLGTDTVVLTGGGTIRLAENGSYSRSIIQLLDGQTLDLVGATIKTPVGYDNYLGYGAGTVLNKATLLADGGSFQINPQTLVNDGEILSTSGTLYLQDIFTLTHRGTMVSQDKIQIDNVGRLENQTTILADGGTVSISNSEIKNSSGVLKAQNGGELVLNSSRIDQGTVINDGSTLRSNGATLHNVNLIGDMTVSPTLTLEDALNFDGTIDLSSTSSTPRKILLGTDTVVLTGGGTIRLAENGSYSRSIIQLLDGQTLDLVGATIKTPVGYDNYLGYGAGTVLNKGTLLADGGSFQINPQTLVNDGEILSTSGTLYLQDIETLTHRGTMVSQDKIQIDNVGGLENQTTILADGGEVSISNSEIQNAAGVLKAQNGGELVLNSSRIDQGAIINDGSTLRSNAATLHNVNLIGDMTVSPTLTLEDALNFDGTIDLSSTSSTPRKILLGTDTVVLTGGGTIRLAENGSYSRSIIQLLDGQTLDLVGATIKTPVGYDNYLGYGAGTVLNKGTLLADGGSFQINPQTLVNDGEILSTSGTLYLQDIETLTHRGTMVSQDKIQIDNVGGLENQTTILADGGEVSISNSEIKNSSGVLKAQNGGELVLNSSRIDQGAIINNGSILRSNAATLHNVNLIGDMTVSPTLTLEDALNFDGTIDLSSTSSTPRKILLGTDTVVLTGGGTIRLAENGSYSRSIIQLLDGQTLDLVGATIKTPVGYDNYLGYGAGTVLNKGTLLADGGSFQINPQTLINDGEILSTGGDLYLQDMDTLTNRGTMASQKKIQISDVGTFDSQGLVSVATGGRINLSSLANGFLNSGNLEIASAVMFSMDGSAFANHGGVDIQQGGSFTKSGAYDQYAGATVVNGILTVPTMNVYGGSVSGSGTIIGDVELYGTVSPGNSPGVLNIDGDLNAYAGSVFQFEVAGYALFDSINITGSLNLLGATTLEIWFLDGFLPQAGDVFNLFGSAGIQGDLSLLTISFVGPWKYDAELGSTGGDIMLALVSGPHPTPIPGAIWLLGTGLVGLIGLRKRFRG